MNIFVFIFRNVRFEQYLQNIDHSLDFVNEALTTSSKVALLKSNRVMSKRLDHLLHQNAIWSKAISPFQLSFTAYDPKNIRSTIANLGVLVQNGRKKFTNNKSTFAQGKFERISIGILKKYLIEHTNGIELKHSESYSHAPIVLDPSEDYCAVCRCGGDLVCCDECPRVYHIDCHVPSLNEISMDEKWKCGLCSEVVNSTLKRKIDDTTDKLTSSEKEICEKLVLQMYTHPSSVPFHHPVPADVRQ